MCYSHFEAHEKLMFCKVLIPTKHFFFLAHTFQYNLDCCKSDFMTPHPSNLGSPLIERICHSYRFPPVERILQILKSKSKEGLGHTLKTWI